MLEQSKGKLRTQDHLISQVLTWIPWVLTGMVTVPLPLLFLVLFFASSGPDSAAFYLLLAVISLALGLVGSLVVIVAFWLYRRTWSIRLRNRLAADGITAAEVPWFGSELTSEERKTWRELEEMNPMLADAYCETLAARLTASRISTRARAEMLRIERQLNRTRQLREADTSSLVKDLLADRHKAELVRTEAKTRLAEAKARLQTIDAAARRELSQAEITLMLQRLSASQDQFPLALELARLEHESRTDSEPSNPN